MIIAISSDGASTDSGVSTRFNTADYVIIYDTVTEEYEAVPNPFSSGQHGAGIQVIMLAVSKGAKAVLSGYTSPSIVTQFKTNGIDVVTGLSGTVQEAVEQYKSAISRPPENKREPEAKPPLISKSILIHALTMAFRQFVSLLPVMLGIVLLTGLIGSFISENILTTIFSGNTVLDMLWGACFGSVFAGNPLNSYIIGGELLNYGVSLFVVTAFIVTWVTVGIVQLPAEIAAFGKRFALLRNGLSLVFAILISFITVTVTTLLTGWIS